MDGVLWTGPQIIEGARDALGGFRASKFYADRVYITLKSRKYFEFYSELLRSKGKRVLFATNNATRSRAKHAAHLHAMGFQSAKQSEAFGSAFAAAAYLRDIHFQVNFVTFCGLRCVPACKL